MDRAVIISVSPEMCKHIVNGEQTLLLRKLTLYIEPPFKVYICPTHIHLSGNVLLFKGKDLVISHYSNADRPGWHKASGNVIGHFICDHISPFLFNKDDTSEDIRQSRLITDSVLDRSCMTKDDFVEYVIGNNKRNIKAVYGWNITKLKIYDKPKSLNHFVGIRKTYLRETEYKLKGTPKTVYYVKERT